jgi:hypothetical protein
MVRERTIPSERPPLVGEVSANFCGYRDCRVVSVADPYGRNLGFLDRRDKRIPVKFDSYAALYEHSKGPKLKTKLNSMV